MLSTILNLGLNLFMNGGPTGSGIGGTTQSDKHSAKNMITTSNTKVSVNRTEQGPGNKSKLKPADKIEFPNGITNIDYIRYEARPYNTIFANRRTDESVILYLPMPAEVNEQLEAGWAAQDDWIKKNTKILGNSLIQQMANEFSAKTNGSPVGPIEGITEKVLGTFGGDGAIRKVTERRRGRILNPVSEQFFTGMSHRTWEFMHKLVPESKSEAEQLDEIINRIKSASSALIDGQDMFLNYPLMWDVKFMTKLSSDENKLSDNEGSDGVNPYLPQINTCAITQVSTNYSGAGAWARHSDGSPVEIDLTLSLTELTIPTSANFAGLKNRSGLGRKTHVGWTQEKLIRHSELNKSFNPKKE